MQERLYVLVEDFKTTELQNFIQFRRKMEFFGIRDVVCRQYSALRTETRYFEVRAKAF